MAKKTTKKRAAKKATTKKSVVKKATTNEEVKSKTEETPMGKTKKDNSLSDKITSDVETITKATGKGFVFSANDKYKVIVQNAINFLEELKNKK